jgi:hypothetical protein
VKRLENIVLQVHVKKSCGDAAGARAAGESTGSSLLCLLPAAVKLLENGNCGTFEGGLSKLVDVSHYAPCSGALPGSSTSLRHGIIGFP